MWVEKIKIPKHIINHPLTEILDIEKDSYVINFYKEEKNNTKKYWIDVPDYKLVKIIYNLIKFQLNNKLKKFKNMENGVSEFIFAKDDDNKYWSNPQSITYHIYDENMSVTKTYNKNFIIKSQIIVKHSMENNLAIFICSENIPGKTNFNENGRIIRETFYKKVNEYSVLDRVRQIDPKTGYIIYNPYQFIFK